MEKLLIILGHSFFIGMLTAVLLSGDFSPLVVSGGITVIAINFFGGMYSVVKLAVETSGPNPHNHTC